MEHNYNNDPNFLEMIENLMNLKNNLPNLYNKDDAISIDNIDDPFLYFECNSKNYYNSSIMQKIRRLFWQNKNKNVFNNNKCNVAIHVRRKNAHDCLDDGTNTPDLYYLKIIDYIRKIYSNKQLLFHIYSQGNKEIFKCYKSKDIVLHIDEPIDTTFIGMVAADILITTRSTFSYTAAVLSDNKIYYTPFWHPPLSHWTIIQNGSINSPEINFNNSPFINLH